MSRICAIHQPSFIPWGPFFHKMSLADVWIHLDDVSFMKNGVQNRNRLKGPQGAFWWTVPVRVSLGDLLRDVAVAGDPRQSAKQWKTVETFYSKAPYFATYQETLADLFLRPWDNLCDLNLAVTATFADLLQIPSLQVRSSEFGLQTHATEHLVELCQAVEADVYVSGAGGLRYMDLSLFAQAGIEVRFQLPETPPYKQLHPRLGFIGGLSILDAILNLGPGAADYVRQCGTVLDQETMLQRQAAAGPDEPLESGDEPVF